jgi:glycerol kinase
VTLASKREDLLLAIDQGTTSTRAMVFDRSGTVRARAQKELKQYFPQPGWVEHDPEEIFAATLAVSAAAMEEAGGAQAIGALGITNQRETTLLWERHTGRPVMPAIVWQDRRTAKLCAELRDAGHEPLIRSRTGLLLDPYFSASKLAWILDTCPNARRQAKKGELAFGTVDSWLIWKLTGGEVHATDTTNASRTLLFNIHTMRWDDDLLSLFDIPSTLLPHVLASTDDFGRTKTEIFGAALPICAVAGDQQAALAGQACFEPGLIKATYGTGCFALVNTGSAAVASANRLLTTPGFHHGRRLEYALEGSIFIAGAAIQWLRDALGVIAHAAESEALAKNAREDAGVWFIPAFTGLGAPYWDAQARGAILGLTRGAGRAEIARAALEAVAFQTRDLLEAMSADMTCANMAPPSTIRIDGGMLANNWFVQALADLTGRVVEKPAVAEVTALGAAYLAGLGAGLYADVHEISENWRSEGCFEPVMSMDRRESRYAGWKQAVRQVLTSQAHQ